MQVLENTPQKLVLEERYSFMAGASWFSAMTLLYGLWTKWAILGDPEKWGIGASCLGFMAVTIYFLRPSIFEFDKVANHFRWTKPGLFKSHHGQAQLDQIRRIRVDASNDDGTKAYRVLVETQGGTIPFQHAYTTSDPNHHYQIVDLIRTWFAR